MRGFVVFGLRFHRASRAIRGWGKGGANARPRRESAAYCGMTPSIPST